MQSICILMFREANKINFDEEEKVSFDKFTKSDKK